MTSRDASARRKNILHKYADNIPRRPAGSDAILPSPVFFHSFIESVQFSNSMSQTTWPEWRAQAEE